MAANSKQKIVFHSKYCERSIGAAEFITELICEKIAIRERKPLSTNFWLNSFWTPIYKKQLHIAKSLITIYPYQAIINALKNPKSEKIYSLGMATSLDPIILEEIKKYEILSQKKTIDSNTSIEQPRSQCKTNKSIIGKLRNLE